MISDSEHILGIRIETSSLRCYLYSTAKFDLIITFRVFVLRGLLSILDDGDDAALVVVVVVVVFQKYRVGYRSRCRRRRHQTITARQN